MRFGSTRIAVTTVFFLHAVVYTSWVPRIPTVQDKLGLSDAQLGLAFLGITVGPLLAMPLAGAAVSRLGSRPVTRVAVLAYCAALPLPVLAPSLITLAAALVLLGLTNGALAVAMNTQGVTVQARYDQAMFSSFHAANSFGGLAGAGLGGLAAAAGISPAIHLSVAAAVFAVVGAIAGHWLLSTGSESSGQGPMFATPTRALAGLGLLAFCALFMEAAVTNWSSVYMSDVLRTSPGVASAAFVAFAFAMALSRLAGDRLKTKWGPVSLMRRGGLLAAAGLGVGLLADQPLAAIAGFGVFGAGIAAVVPAALNAAGDNPDQPGDVSIAAVSTVSYFGFLAGPAAFGFVAGGSSLPAAFGILAVLAGLVAVLAGRTVPPSTGSQTKGEQAESKETGGGDGK